METKKITQLDAIIHCSSWRETVEEYRKWTLSGEDFKWKYYIDHEGNLILERE